MKIVVSSRTYKVVRILLIFTNSIRQEALELILTYSIFNSIFYSFLYLSLPWIITVIIPTPLKLRDSNFQRRWTKDTSTLFSNQNWIVPLAPPWEDPNMEQISELKKLFGPSKMLSSIKRIVSNY